MLASSLADLAQASEVVMAGDLERLIVLLGELLG